MVAHVENWIDGLAFPERVNGTAATISSDADGLVSPTLIWNSTQVGKYDTIVDLNGNGKYEEEIDKPVTVEVAAEPVNPEPVKSDFLSSFAVPLFAVAVLGTAALLAVLIRKRHAQTHQSTIREQD